MMSKTANRWLSNSKNKKTMLVALILVALIMVASGLYIFTFRDEPGQSAKKMGCGEVSEAANDMMDQFKYADANSLLKSRYSECILNKDKSVVLVYGVRTAISYYETGDKEQSKQISSEMRSMLSTVSDKDRQTILDRYSVYTDAIFDISRDSYSGIGGIE